MKRGRKKISFLVIVLVLILAVSLAVPSLWNDLYNSFTGKASVSPAQTISISWEKTMPEQLPCQAGFTYLLIYDDEDKTHDVNENEGVETTQSPYNFCGKAEGGIEATWAIESPGAEWINTNLKHEEGFGGCYLSMVYPGDPKQMSYSLYLKAKGLESGWYAKCPPPGWVNTGLSDEDDADGHGCGESSPFNGGEKVWLCLKQTIY